MYNYLEDSRVMLIAHRGFSTDFPENTRAAFEPALESNIDMLEIDIHRTKDNYLVVIHDDTINRTSNGKGKVKDHSLNLLMQFDYGVTKHLKFKGQHMMTLEEVLVLIKNYPQKLLIEIKQPHFYPGIGQQLIDMLKKHDIPEGKVIIQSFDQQCIRNLYEMGVGFKLGVLISKKKYWYKMPNFDKIAVYADYVNPHYSLVNHKFMTAAHSLELSVMPYTVNEATIANKLIMLGVDGLISDNPIKLI
ncbi:glycerophosphodiester phosphodiesterase [Staphylococcus xylosus]|uniref:glycerophosphodiester phosphodiesterase n=1 Tax=Staphylococcus xylosus TaxID=1288 RepID=UPI000421C090|nr:glycerophosphodiester phosphodiesterase family protein [Staphylococcus xylosus]AID01679.1 glycerophosphodiester phosphodiesterase [Staphylococcus xylosus]KTW23877.1 glycerophosphodiester phosphodiesterase [Staphylococcus xylosus]MBO3073460.1 glycerophosphodiester phosphodiesterase [Staphylococcus xylosus]MBV5139476.1 glycerophosphodiester phosphodiesterase [Staphylococcus xylosus]MBW3126048.1 glycerophosphodiester phosphodiesterase [Staphylococcus xylosus]